MKCKCGCGTTTNIVKHTVNSKGIKKGDHREYVHGHHAKGSGNGRWNGGRKMSYGFVMVYSPHHPAQIKNYVYEHRLVMEKHLGRFLVHPECVHHLNEKQDDNRIENLVLCKSNSEHMKKYHPDNGKATRFKKGWNK